MADPLVDALRKRNEATRARARGLQFQGIAGSAGPNTVSAGANTPTEINWGGIIQGAIGNYQAAKSNKQADTLDKEAESLNQQFMEDTFKSDPESYRLTQMAQAGVPGAEEALSQRVAPKKEALGAFLQHLQSGVADEGMIQELAPRYGLSPEMAARAAKVAKERKLQEAQGTHDLKMEEIRARQEGRPARQAPAAAGGGISFQEYMAMSPDQREEYDKFKGRRGSTTSGGMTPGERNVRAKTLVELDKDLQRFGTQESKFNTLRPMLNDPEVFGPTQKAAQLLEESDLPVVGGLARGVGTFMRSEPAVLMEDYLNDEVLRRMAALGGNDSNEELNRMRASLPKAMNNQEAALALMDQLAQWQGDTKEAVRRRREAMQSGEYFDQDATPRDFYKEVVEGRGAQQPAGQQPAGQQPAAPPRGKIKILSIE